MRKFIWALAALFIVHSSVAENNKVKNVILLIGDGMGAPQVGLLESYAQHATNNIYADKPTALQSLAAQGKTVLSLTSPHDFLVTDSACSATQLATGISSRSEMIGLDHNGNPAERSEERRVGKECRSRWS